MTTATLSSGFVTRSSGTTLSTWIEVLSTTLAMSRAIHHDHVSARDVEKVRAIAAAL